MSTSRKNLSEKIVTFVCNSCSSSYDLLSGDTSSKTVQLDICAACHPFYLGKLASETNLGPAEKLKEKFNRGRTKLQ
ncbi:50S ribosomal protein L31 [Candidatus Mycoplasma haematolamae str. Purdue]|uniref:50S ribosomal protein L31 n=1 Tax=Mycoplasma haematolamae (strain Purdue) TaxID=1212765 RepID=I7C7H4_MYCHA|nr:50S ribosomal protein L31 [Candidatus Mycoplasma haematolamae]AFO52487.1 50S ribosomal protein L31 [Candidatus Mycoplasma haematolamae str. Purdue]